MKSLQKYMLLLFLIANMTAEYALFQSISNYLFYGILGLSICFVLGRYICSKEAVNKCPELYIMAGILIGYQLFLSPDIESKDALLYLVAKIATFIIIMFSVGKDYELYQRRMIMPFSYLIVLLIFIGWVGGFGIKYGFLNRNAACALASIGFAGFLFGRQKYSKIEYVFMLFLLIAILMGGSRNALAMCIICIMFRYGFSFNLILVLSTLLFLIAVILPEIGIEIEAFNRLVQTITGELATDRDAQREGALMMIQGSPWRGWGLASHIQGQALEISHYGAHNGYLTILMYMGYPIGIAFIGTILVGIFKRLRLYKLNDNALKYHLSIMIAILFAANQEDYLIGVNQIVSNMFFVSFVVTGFALYYHKKAIRR